MRYKIILSYLLFILICTTAVYPQNSDGKVINDVVFKFTMTLPEGWETKDIKQTSDNDGISYSLESKDKKMAIMLLAFKLSSVKNIEDFIYNLEKDISLNIPPKSGEYSDKDFGMYDMKNAHYKDNRFEETIYYFRTKMPDSPNNFVYMVRFITEAKDYNSDTERQVESIAGTFAPTAE
jgi:hypothetical protein